MGCYNKNKSAKNGLYLYMWSTLHYVAFFLAVQMYLNTEDIGGYTVNIYYCMKICAARY